ncbi:hypothetical protein GXP67_32715 [Rhodocytophaga rosea]|uniref:SGNH/GDSL hydrolase family protein n=1 Tax=Rhodocytophaga rosea TaxID=2704465 RepID=A0A6C0GSJ7_9BACT|nr:hypothetical protein [Rhodocytophaga rosea]QHT71079.1 hypothetical protein GXP67_32715 [Rhodocytophaga rosea]
MKKFLLKCTLFATGIGTLFIILLIYKVSTENPFSVLFHLKNRQLVQLSNEPKMIIIGGSNARYGFDSRFLEKKLGRPVINAAITYHQGLAYYLEWSKKHLKAGDYVLLSPEYTLSSSREGLFGTHKLIDVAYQNKDFRNFLLSDSRILFNQLIQTHSIVNQSMESLLTNDPEKKELLASHNLHGDAINCIGKSKNFVPTKITIQKPDQQYFELLNEYAAFCRSKGVKVFISFPPARKKSVTMEIAPSAVVAQTKQKVSDFTVLNTPESALYPDRYFFDSSYHLNQDGKQLHTQQVYTNLQQILSKQNDPLLID